MSWCVSLSAIDPGFPPIFLEKLKVNARVTIRK
jgi:hypothetical protein